MIKIFSLVKLVTACNRWRGSASHANDPRDRWSLRWDGTSKRKLIKIFMAPINQLTEKLAVGAEEQLPSCGVNSLETYLCYTFHEL